MRLEFNLADLNFNSSHETWKFYVTSREFGFKHCRDRNNDSLPTSISLLEGRLKRSWEELNTVPSMAAGVARTKDHFSLQRYLFFLLIYKNYVDVSPLYFPCKDILWSVFPLPAQGSQKLAEMNDSQAPFLCLLDSVGEGESRTWGQQWGGGASPRSQVLR